jgi:hypothetical protein
VAGLWAGVFCGGREAEAGDEDADEGAEAEDAGDDGEDGDAGAVEAGGREMATAATVAAAAAAAATSACEGEVEGAGFCAGAGAETAGDDGAVDLAGSDRIGAAGEETGADAGFEGGGGGVVRTAAGGAGAPRAGRLEEAGGVVGVLGADATLRGEIGLGAGLDAGAAGDDGVGAMSDERMELGAGDEADEARTDAAGATIDEGPELGAGDEGEGAGTEVAGATIDEGPELGAGDDGAGSTFVGVTVLGATAWTGAAGVDEADFAAAPKLSREGGGGGVPGARCAAAGSLTISEVCLLDGSSAAGVAGSSAGGRLRERIFEAMAAPAARSAAPDKLDEDFLSRTVVCSFAGALGGARGAEVRAGGGDKGPEVVGAVAAVCAGTGDSDDVAGRLAPRAVSRCEGRLASDEVAGAEEGGLSEEVGASELVAVRDTVAGRGGIVGGCADDTGAGGVPAGEPGAGVAGDADEVDEDGEAGAEGAPPEGRTKAGMVGSGGGGVICAVGASPETVVLFTEAGRGGTAGGCGEESAGPGTIDCEARLTELPAAGGVGTFGGTAPGEAGAEGAADAPGNDMAVAACEKGGAGAALAGSAGTCGGAGRWVLRGSCGGRGLSEM